MPRKKIVPAETTQPAQEQAAPTSPLTNDQLVQEHFGIDDYIDAESKRFKEFLKPLMERDEEIKKILFARMIEQGQPNITTNHGTAYTSTIVTPKVTDREKYLDLVMDHYDTFGAGLLQVGAPQKSAFDEYVERRRQEITQYQEAHGGALPDDVNILPPGVEISSFVRVNIRRS